MKTNLFAKSTRLMASLAILCLFTNCYEKLAVEDMTIEVGQEYNSRFEEIIGDFDPTHTWSTAATSMLSVDVQIPGNHVVRVYTSNPMNGKAYLLGKYEINSTGERQLFKLDVPAALKNVYVTLDAGQNKVVKKVALDENRNIDVAFEMTRTVNVNGNEWNNCPTVKDNEEQLVWDYLKGTSVKHVSLVNLSNYWVTQIHKGTKEECTYKDGNGSDVYGPEKMNQLSVATDPNWCLRDTVITQNGWSYKQQKVVGYEHVYNFNGATNTDWGGNTLMVNTGCYDFAYSNSSDGGKLYNDYIVVRGEDIDYSLRGNYYICFNFNAHSYSESNKNEQIEGDNLYTDWIVRVTEAYMAFDGSMTGEVPIPWIIACEDIGGLNSDFDYNDIVFEVTRTKADMAVIRPLAAGGTLKAYILYRISKSEDWKVASTIVDGYEFSEVHQWISQNPNAPSTKMLNTLNEVMEYPIENIPTTGEFYLGSIVSMADFSDYFCVRVVKSDGSSEDVTFSDAVNVSNEDNRVVRAPRLICISGESPEWCWMQETVHITDGYTTFSNWAETKTASLDWYKRTTNNLCNIDYDNLVRRTSSPLSFVDEDDETKEIIPSEEEEKETEEEEGCEYIIKLNGEEITGKALTYTNGQSGTIELWKRSTTKPESMVTENVRLETSDNSVINCGGTYFSVNNPRPVTNTEFIFEKAEGSKNDITNDNKQGTLSVVSKSKKTYGNSQSISNIQMKVMIGSDTTPYGTFTINVEGEAGYTENDYTVDNDIHWFEGEWNWKAGGSTSYSYDFTSATTTTIIAKQQNADPNNSGNQTAYLRWEVNVTGDEDNTSSGSEGAFSVGTTTLTKEDIEKSYYTGDEGHYNPKVTFPGALFANATQEIVVMINTTQSLSSTSANFGKNVYIPNVPYEYNEGNKYCTLTDNLFTMTLKDDNLSLIKKNGLELVINGGNYEYGLISSIEFIIQ